MSNVTDVIIASTLANATEDWQCSAIPFIDEWLKNHGHFAMLKVDDMWKNRKAMQAFVYIGAFNYLALADFIEKTVRAFAIRAN